MNERATGRNQRSTSGDLSVKLPPQNLAAERSVLGCVLLDGSTIDDIRLHCRADMFYADAHQKIFAAAVELWDSGKKIDAVTLADRLETNGMLADAGGAMYLMEILETVPHTAHAAEYAQIVAKFYQRRETVQLGRMLLERGHDAGDDIQEVITAASDRLIDTLTLSETEPMQDFGDMMIDALQSIDRRRKTKSKMAGITWGLRDLDSLTLGLCPGQMVVIAARPGMGKTAFMMHTAMVNAAEGRCVAIFSLEMPKVELGERVLSRDSRVPLRQIRNGDMTDGDRLAVCDSAASLAKSHVYIDDNSGLTVDDIGVRCRKIRKKVGKLDLIIVDYLQLVRPTKGKKYGNRQEEVGEISRKLKELSKTLKCPVMALSQLNRGVEARAEKRPTLGDLRESGAIEQDADQIIFLYRPWAYTPEKSNPNYCELIVAKNRAGETGAAKAFVRLSICTFNNASGDMHEETSRGADNADDPSASYSDEYQPFPD